MNRRLFASSAALNDAANIAHWYRSQAIGVDVAFAQVVDRVIAQIAAFPESYQIVVDDFRRAILHPFPFVLLYRVSPQTIEITAILSTHADPSRLTARTSTEPL